MFLTSLAEPVIALKCTVDTKYTLHEHQKSKHVYTLTSECFCFKQICKTCDSTPVYWHQLQNPETCITG